MKKNELVTLIREEIKGALKERELTAAEKDDKEDIGKELSKKEAQFKADYGEDWEQVMWATATNKAKKGD